MGKTKLNRRQLALRIFGVIMLVNSGLWLCFAPEASEKPTELAADLVELKIRATLHTTYALHKQVMLTRGGFSSLGPVTLLEQQNDLLVVALPRDLYRQYHRELTQAEWSALPYLDGLKTAVIMKGTSYEITY